jgi:hypothetical protein
METTKAKREQIGKSQHIANEFKGLLGDYASFDLLMFDVETRVR